MEQRSPEWFAARAGRVTGSQVGGLLGLSPHVSEGDAFRALVRSVHGLDSEFKGNVATEYGSFHEDGAKQGSEGAPRHPGWVRCQFLRR